MRIAVVTPMAEELTGIRDHLLACGFGAQDGVIGRLPVVQFSELGITLAVGGVGKVQFGVQVQHLLDAGPDRDLVICAGAAGALSDRLSIGDVVVGTRTVEHDYIGRFGYSPMPTFDGDAKMLESLEKESESPQEHNVLFGAIASGDEDIVEPARREAIRDRTDALAVAWEGAGGARACKFNEMPYVEVRGVTDGADESAPEDFQANLRLAMGSVAELLTRWLTNQDTEA